MKRYFTIKNFPTDVYTAVGQIIQSSQEWEDEYKKLAKKLDISTINIDNASLNRLNEALKKNKLIEEKEFNDLKSVIGKRNNINHTFFLTDFRKYAHKYDMLEDTLNEIQFLIYEATDIIDNKLDKLQGSEIMRPTVFDEQKK